MKYVKKTTLAVILIAWISTALHAENEPVYSKLPVREVTIFKDGHAFVLHQGQLPTLQNGNIILDQIPNPVMGTFWAYSADPKRKLECVISSREDITVEKTPTSIEDLIKGNVGSKVIIIENNEQTPYQAEIVRLLEDQSASSATTPPQSRYYQSPAPGQKIALLKTTEGIKAINVSQIRNITFLGSPNETTPHQQTRDTLTLKLEPGQKKTANIGMGYIQRGIRWIPSYRVDINDKGKAVIKLQGTIINELADLDDVSAHLVIGAPSFAFENTPDPISFQETVAQLSSHFRPDSSTAYAFSNAVMSQRAAYHGYDEQTPPNMVDLGPELKDMKSNEDLFIFTLDHLTLKKGQRMVLPIAEYELNYKDIYTVDITFRPPLEMQRNFNSDQHLKMAQLFHAPRAIHKIRLNNQSKYPLTTAPATILKNGQVLAQGMMQFTSIGSTGDLEITTALDIKVKTSDAQNLVTPNDVKWNGDSYSKVDMVGAVELTNFGEKSVTVYVKRSVLGNMDEVTQEGTIKQLGHGYDGFVFESDVPVWWNWCNWPWWWYHFNSIGQAEWQIELNPKEEVKLNYNWHYYWR